MPTYGDVRQEAAPATGGRRGVLLLVLTVLLGLAAGAGATAYGQSRPAQYTSHAQVLMDQPRALTYSVNEGVVTKLSSLRFKYAGLVRTRTFADGVSSKTGISTSEVQDALVPVVLPTSLLLQVNATTGSPQTSQDIAQAAADKLSQDLAQEQEQEGVPPGERITLTVVDPAQLGGKVSPTRRRSAELGLGAFVAVLLGVGLLRDLSRRRTSREGVLA